jgi:hypothetical protein
LPEESIHVTSDALQWESEDVRGAPSLPGVLAFMLTEELAELERERMRKSLRLA